MPSYESADENHDAKEHQQNENIKEAIYKEYRKTYSDSEHKIKELEQINDIDSSLLKNYAQREFFLKKKIRLLLGCIIVIISITVTLFFPTYILNDSSSDVLKSQFLIQNLKGDYIDTWISWKVVENTPFHIHLIENKFVTEDRLDAIIDVIMSTETIDIDDSLMHKGPEGQTSTYFVGWQGVFSGISKETENPLPKSIHFDIAGRGEGNVLIELTNLSNPDGYSGFTKSIADEQNNQILKSTIMIYDIEKRSIEELKTILRHELGHSFGLAHSTAPEDLMYPVILTEYPYISPCDIDAIVHLYDGGKTSKVVCEE